MTSNAIPAEATLFIEDISAFGEDAGKGNLVGVQPFMEPPDYATAASYHRKLSVSTSA